jgi:hydrogenase nickel incorporation protein HypA/HybF
MEAAARDAGAKRVTGVEVWLGALSRLSAQDFREHFAHEARDTVAEGAELRIEVSSDLNHPQAQSVVMNSVDLEV